MTFPSSIKDREYEKFVADLDDNTAVKVLSGKSLKDIHEFIHGSNLLAGEVFNGVAIQELNGGSVAVVHYLQDGSEVFFIAMSTNTEGDITAQKFVPIGTISMLFITTITNFKNKAIGSRFAGLSSYGDINVVFSIIQDVNNAFEILEGNIIYNTRLIDEGTYPIVIRAVGASSELIESFEIVVSGAGEINNINLSSLNVAVDSVVDAIVGIFSISGGAPPATFVLDADAGGVFKIVNDNELRVASAPVGLIGDLLPIVVTATDINGSVRTESFTIEVVLSTFINDFSYNFNGVDEFLKIDNDASLYGGQFFSCVGWVKQIAFGGSNAIASHFGAGGTRSWRFYVDNTGLLIANLSQNGTASENTTSATSIDVNAWNFVAFTFDGIAQECKIWINGVLSITNPITITELKNTTVPMRIGARGDSAVDEIDFFDGNIDEVSIYSKSLTQTDVDSLYNNGVPNNPTATTGAPNLISWWRMGDNYTGTIDPDEVLSNDATLFNMNNSNRDSDVPL